LEHTSIHIKTLVCLAEAIKKYFKNHVKNIHIEIVDLNEYEEGGVAENDTLFVYIDNDLAVQEAHKKLMQLEGGWLLKNMEQYPDEVVVNIRL
jgi:hypothetical protein